MHQVQYTDMAKHNIIEVLAPKVVLSYLLREQHRPFSSPPFQPFCLHARKGSSCCIVGFQLHDVISSNVLGRQKLT